MCLQKIGEASINIVAVSPHRREALQGVAWAIDELKMKVPIWKKEYYEDGEIGENIQCQHSAAWKSNPEFKELREKAKDY